ncbi:methionyl-tRNA formyltransferase [Thalassotalea sp. ND16A]|uniref:methionyl-tRNA formyltransferase n=1 Tax=Thalassotalea sp. ND16A TaxID=1535422 RepID=UPI00051A16C9|nr:methionyl-tRNA formyltransferase [Thalassotalea sp. ND16A]KGJ88225.1 Methionyl-tRNA formyltransferase [Thalassotalea sp. ND16A]
MSTPLNIIFAGTPDFAAKHLQALISSQHNIKAVYCPPDKPAGRGKKLQACAVKQLALAHDIAIEQPTNFKTEQAQQTLARYQADVMVVVAYGLLLPQVILDTPRLGCVNVHGSLLPRWRGAAPIQRSLQMGDCETGVTIMQMDKGLDTGAMLFKASCPITNTDTSASLYQKLAELGPQALLNTMEQMSAGTHHAEPQDNTLANYADKLTKDEAELDFSLAADVLDRKIRAFQPWPFTQITYNDNGKEHRIKVWQVEVISEAAPMAAGFITAVDKSGICVATGNGQLKFTCLQLPGKKALAVSDILNGRADWFKVGSHICGSSINSPVDNA